MRLIFHLLLDRWFWANFAWQYYFYYYYSEISLKVLLRIEIRRLFSSIRLGDSSSQPEPSLSSSSLILPTSGGATMLTRLVVGINRDATLPVKSTLFILRNRSVCFKIEESATNLSSSISALCEAEIPPNPES